MTDERVRATDRDDSERHAPRGIWGLLADPVFGTFFAGKFLSTCGSWLHGLVAAIVAFHLTGSAFVVGLAGAAQFIPQLFLAPLSGRLADSGNAVTQMLVGRVLCGIGSLSLATAILVSPTAGHPVGGVPMVLGTTLVVGIGFVTGGPAMQAIVPAMIRPGEMGPAMALNSIPITTSRALGPAIGAVLTGLWGPGVALVVAAVAAFVHAAIVVILPLPSIAPKEEGADYSIGVAVRYVGEDRVLGLLLVALALTGLASDPSLTLAPSLADAAGDDGLTGWITAAFGVGAIVGFFVLHAAEVRLGSGGIVRVGLAMMAASLGLAAIPLGRPWLLTAFVVGGLGMTLAFTGLTTLVQERSPDQLRGRIMALWFVAFVGTRPFGSAAIGLVADAVTLEAALLLAAALALVGCWWCRPSRMGLATA